MGSFNHFHRIAAELPRKAEAFVAAYAAYWQSAASQLAAVDTGDLEGSVQFVMEGPHQARIAATMDYAIHVEFGTIDSAAQPFLRPSRDALAAVFQRDLRSLLKP